MQRATILLAPLLSLSLLMFAPRSVANAAPPCDTVEQGTYVDNLRGSADEASRAGRHARAMNLFAKAADYQAACAPVETRNTRQRASAQGNDYDPSSAFYSGPMTTYIDAAREALKAGLRRERCLYARRSRIMQLHTDARREAPDSEMRTLLKGC